MPVKPTNSFRSSNPNLAQNNTNEYPGPKTELLLVMLESQHNEHMDTFIRQYQIDRDNYEPRLWPLYQRAGLLIPADASLSTEGKSAAIEELPTRSFHGPHTLSTLQRTPGLTNMSNGPPVSSQHLPHSHFKILATAVLHTAEIEIHPMSARETHWTSTETVLDPTTDPHQPTTLYMDNKSAITLGQDMTCEHKKARHYMARLQYPSRNHHQVVKLEHLDGTRLPADMLSKAKPRPRHEQNTAFLMGPQRLDAEDRSLQTRTLKTAEPPP